MVLLTIAIAFVAGKWAMLSLVDVVYPNVRSPGIGIVGVPMTFFLAAFSIVFVFVEVSRFAAKRSRRRLKE